MDGDQPVARPLPALRTKLRRNKRIHTSLTRVRFELTTPVFRTGEDNSCITPRGHCGPQYGCVDPHILDLISSWRWVVSFTLRPFYFRRKSIDAVLIWGLVCPRSVWTTWRGERSCPYRDSNSDPSAVQHVAGRLVTDSVINNNKNYQLEFGIDKTLRGCVSS
jgi:hypothetical protein